MSLAENLYESDLPTRHDVTDTSFHQEAVVLRRHDLVEDSWRDFLELNEDCQEPAARAKAAINCAELINYELSRQGLDRHIAEEPALRPLLVNAAIDYLARDVLLEFFRSENLDPAMLAPEKDTLHQSRDNFKNAAKEYVAVFNGEHLDKAYQGLLQELDYASLVILGAGINRQEQKHLLYRLLHNCVTSKDDRQSLGVSYGSVNRFLKAA